MKKEKMNNKGFSLVELIIVIAIMAVLVVVLAPQYLKYVEKSRNSTDASNATSIVTALQVWAADPEAGEGSTTAFKKDDEVTIKIEASGGSLVTGGTGNAAAQSALDEAAINLSTTKCKSKTNWTLYQIKATVQEDGSLLIDYDPGSTTEGAAFEAYMTK